MQTGGRRWDGVGEGAFACGLKVERAVSKGRWHRGCTGLRRGYGWRPDIRLRVQYEGKRLVVTPTRRA